MKIMRIIIVVIVIVLVGVSFWMRGKDTVTHTPPENQVSSIVGCYQATILKDVYTLNIQTVNGENFSGTLRFKNFEKDSSSGIYTGTYKNDILLGEYTFQSEGMQSVMEVIFKKSGDDFIRGYGDLNEEGTRFTNPSAITYDASSPLSLFKKGACVDQN